MIQPIVSTSLLSPESGDVFFDVLIAEIAATALLALSCRRETAYGGTRFKRLLVRELLKNGDVPKSPLPPIAAPVAYR
jgi:hypothetical protein